MDEFSRQLGSLTWNLRQSERKRERDQMFVQTSEWVFTKFMTLLGQWRSRRIFGLDFNFKLLFSILFTYFAALRLKSALTIFRENVFFSHIFSQYLCPFIRIVSLSAVNIPYQQILIIKLNILLIIHTRYNTDAACSVITLETAGSIFLFSHTFASSRIAEIVRK